MIVPNMTGIYDKALNVFGLRRVLNSPENKIAERRLKDLSESQEAIRTIAREVSYDLTKFQNYVQGYFDPSPIHRNVHFEGLYSYYESDVDSKVASSFAQRQDTLANKPWMVRP